MKLLAQPIFRSMQISLERNISNAIFVAATFVWRIGRIHRVFYHIGEVKGVNKGSKTCCKRRRSLGLVLLFNEVLRYIILPLNSTDLHVDLNSSAANLVPSNSVSTITSNLLESTSPASGSSTPRPSSFIPVCDLGISSPSESPGLPASHQDYRVRELTCLGQSIRWEPGAVWDSYAFHQHLDDNTMPWDPIRFNGPNHIVLRSKNCNKQLSDVVGDDIKARTCHQCQYIPNSVKFKRFMERNSRDELPQRTPWKYMNWRQLRQTLIKNRENFNVLKLKVASFILSRNIWLTIQWH
jgi:hypothetical protein